MNKQTKLKAINHFLDFAKAIREAQDKHELEHIKQLVFLKDIAKDKKARAIAIHDLHIN